MTIRLKLLSPMTARSWFAVMLAATEKSEPGGALDHIGQPYGDALIDAAIRIFSAEIGCASRHTGQDLDALVDRLDRDDLKPSVLAGLDHVAAQHEMPHIR